MLWPSIFLLLAFIIFAVILGVAFLMPLLVVAANAIILYFLSLRIYTELVKYGRGKLYAICGAISIFILLITDNFMPTWWITTAALMTFFIVHMYIIYEKKKG